MNASRADLWQRRTEIPLAVAAVLFLAAYAWPILDPTLDAAARRACVVVNLATWVLFAVDYVVRLALAPDRRRWFVRHLVDLGAVALPLLRPLRLLRIVTLLRVMNRAATVSLRGRVAVYVGGATLLVVFCAALAELNAERAAPGANIRSFDDALWWAVETVSTVGYGDRYPVTTQGRLVAVALMIAGIALIGVVTASFASWLIDKVRAVDVETAAATRRDVALVHRELQNLRHELEARRQHPDNGPVGNRSGVAQET